MGLMIENTMIEACQWHLFKYNGQRRRGVLGVLDTDGDQTRNVRTRRIMMKSTI